jgi:hypothetical protein
MTTQLICYHWINDSYSEFRPTTIVNATTNRFITILRENKFNNTSSLFEVISSKSMLKLFMDIEYVPDNNTAKGIINKFIRYFASTYKVNIEKFVVTKNRWVGRRKKHSYHVVFTDLQFTLVDIRHIVVGFIIKYPDYNKYIDLSCYVQNSLFRCIEQYSIDAFNQVRSDNLQNYHSFYDIEEDKFINESEITMELIRGSIIQDIKHCDRLKLYIPKQSPGLIPLLTEYKKLKGFNKEPLFELESTINVIFDKVTKLETYMQEPKSSKTNVSQIIYYTMFLILIILYCIMLFRDY